MSETEPQVRRRSAVSDEEFLKLAEQSIPTVEEIEHLMQGNCHHGKAVPLCEECAPGRLFEATVQRLAEKAGLSREEAATYAAGALADIQHPRCCHESCTAEARWKASFRLRLFAAGKASGAYEGEFDGGGVCQKHRDEFDAEAWKRALVERACRAQGFEIPAGARWRGSATWHPIQGSN